MEPTHFESLYPEETRFEEIKKVLSFIKKGNSCQVVGLPGVGKSNLLGMLSYNRNVRLKHLGENQKWFHFVYMDFSEVKRRSFADVIKFILISLAYSLLERNLKEEHNKVNSFLKGIQGFSDDLILFQALKGAVDYLAIEKELTIVFLFDRFDQYIPAVSENFFSNLKILRNRAKYRFSCIFALNRPLEEYLEPQVFADFYEFLTGKIVYLPLYDPKGLSFRFSYLEKVSGKRGREKVKEEIIKLTTGHGKLSRLSYEVVLSDSSKISSLSEFLLSKPTIRGALYEIWVILTPSEQKLIVDSSLDPGPWPLAGQAGRRSGGQAKSKAKSFEEEGVVYLNNVGLMKNGKITIPLFEEFIKMIPAKKPQEIKYDPERNEIFKGEELVTEKLSPSEFRLLRFLIQNKGRVCEKDEIIGAVWRGSKTLEGVTDQALDQIVYRLRKKIEDNPNDPVFIKTVKGRGYRFED